MGLLSKSNDLSKCRNEKTDGGNDIISYNPNEIFMFEYDTFVYYCFDKEDAHTAVSTGKNIFHAYRPLSEKILKDMKKFLGKNYDPNRIVKISYNNENGLDVTETYKDRKLHSDSDNDKPARVFLDAEEWYENGLLHRDNGPAEIKYYNGQISEEVWRNKGKYVTDTYAVVHYENGQPTHYRNFDSKTGELSRELDIRNGVPIVE
jgi:hypothetical protein